MSDYIKQWIEIIENMSNDNTYKLAWGRAILELIIEQQEMGDEIVFTFYDIGHKMLKYYWNQMFFFHLKQGPKRIPVVVQETLKCIEYYKEETNSTKPEWFDKAEVVLLENKAFYDKQLNKIASTLKHDVCYRFKNANSKTYEIYRLNKQDKEIYFTKKQVEELKEYSIVLSQLLNYRWAQLLEKFNSSPRIALKVKGISDAKLKRNSLKKYANFLINQMEDNKIIDFYTGEVLNPKDVSVDHVIPWSYMYSDDIWNLVLTSKSKNSSKSNQIPTEEIIEKLEIRNQELLKHKTEDKYYSDLKIAVDNNYVRKFYLSCKL